MMQPDDPPFLTVGTEVSAKYKGAFCEAKVNKVVKVVKVKITFKYGNGSAVVLDDCIKGVLKVGAQVKALHPDKNQHIDGIINKIQDCSQYTVVFDDGDITTLRRSSLCLKSGRHFAESETLDQLPLTHPEHFGTPVVGGRRGRRSRHHLDSDEASSEEEDNVHKRHRSRREEWESDIGKVVCVEIGDKKKQKDNWFPGLVVAPTAQDTVKIETKKDYLVRSFQDGRYYTVPKKEATNFSREIGSKVTQSSLRTAVEKAFFYIDRDELPPHWDRDLLFGVDVSDMDMDKDSDSDTSDDEPREEKDHFVAQLYKYMEECGTPINKGPTIGAKDLDLYKLFKIVQKLGGFNRVMNQNQWKVVSGKMCLHNLGQSAALVKAAYKKYLQSFEDFYRKLGCTMVSSPRGSRTRHRSGRSLIRDCDKRPTKKKGKGGETDSAGDDTDRKDEDTEEEDVKKEVVVKVEVEEERKPEKKEKEETPQRTSTPVLPSRTMSPTTRERTKELKSLRSEKPKAKSVPKEEPKIKKEPEEPKKKEVKEEVVVPSSPVPSARKSRADDARRREIKEEKKIDTDSEEEAEEKTQKRSLRNRDDKDSLKRDENETQKKPSSEKKVRPDPHQRSASCNSTSSGTSCTSTGTSSSTCFASDSKSGVKGKTQVLKSQTSLEDLKKRGRKKRNEEVEMPSGKPLLPAHIPICVGDKLRVLYGPNNKESKVTYEAKVLEVEENTSQKMYYVHYLGWNTRYDEWVIRQRVAQNLTWIQNKAKKGRGASKEAEDKKSEKDEKKEKEVVPLSSSSPRLASQPPKRGRPFSSGRRESERSDSASSTRTSTRSEKSNAPHSHSASPSSERPAERRRSKRNISVSNRDTEESETEESESGSDERDNDPKGNEVPLPSPPNSESSPVVSSVVSKTKKDDSHEPRVKQEPVSQISSATPSPSSCGKDIDMKAIESEMKGLDKPIKKEDGLNIREVTGRILTTVIPGSLTITEKKKHDPKKPFDSPVKRVEIPVRLVPAQEIMGQIKPVPISGMKKEPLLEDDIYEFKEPEPFEFSDIRSRKECKNRAHGGSPQDETEPEAKVKKKGRPKRDGDKSDGESDSGPITPQKRNITPSKEVRESPAKRTEGKETPKKELKDYSRKPEILKTPDEKMKEVPKEPVRIVSPPCLQIKESNSECLEKPLLIDFFSKERQLPRIPLDIKDLKLELTDSKESHFFGSSVVITPKKVPLKKETISSVEPVTPVKVEPSELVPKSLKLDIKEEGSFSKDPPKIGINPNTTNVKPISVVLDKPSSAPLLSRMSGPTGHVMAPVVMPPIESRVLAKPSVKPLSIEPASDKGFIITPSTSVQALSVLKQEEKPDGKMMPFSQRQQHIFPHLLNRSETSEDKIQNITIQRTVTTTSTVAATPVVASPINTHSTHLQTMPESPSVSITTLPKVSVIEAKADIEKPLPSEKLKCESTTVEESIEAVVLRARQDQTAADEEKKDVKIGEKRKRISGRSKKTVSREFVPDTSEESDNDVKFEKGEHRQKRLKVGDRGKYSPAKKGTRLSGDGDKKVMKRCDEEERANDADEEDNEGNFVPQKTPTKELIRRRKDSEEVEKDLGDRDSRLSKKKRVSAFRRPEENEEAALGDLLCEETIPPGSPMPQDTLTADSEAPTLPSVVKHEMPFASVPTGSSFSKRGPTPLSAMQANLHKSLQQLHPSVCIQSVTKNPSSGTQPYGPIPPPTIQPNVTITSLSPNAPPHTLPTAKVSSLSFRGPSLPPIVSAPVRTPSKISVEVVPKPVVESGASGINVYNPEPNSAKLVTNSPSSIVMPAADLGLQKNEEPKMVLPRAGSLPNLDNTPPTTPESIVSNLSDSPQRENDSSKIDETSKSGGQYSSEMETDNKLDNYSEDSNTMDSNASVTKCHNSKRPSSLGSRGPCQQSHSEGWDTEDGGLAPPKRRKKGLRKSHGVEEESIKCSVGTIAAVVNAAASLSATKRRRRHSSSRASNRCDDENDPAHGLNTLSLAACNSPRGKLKYNFCQELDPDLDQSKRIAVLQNRMQELKRTYRHVKAELASVERRRKKLKKKEKEKEAQQEGN